MRAAITGAASGIGAETVKKLKERGYDVTAFDIQEPPSVDRWIKVDMSDPASIDAAVAQAEGPFDCLINNAGLPPRQGQSAKVLAVNFVGLVQLIRRMEGKLVSGGAIVNTASRAGAGWRENIDEVKALLAIADPAGLEPFIDAQGIDYVRAYNLSKEAVIVWGFANTARLLTAGLRVNSVSPAAVSTGILDDFTAAFGDKVAANIARVGRPGLPAEVADVIAFLASPESHWIKGQDLTIDGGMSGMSLADMMGV